MTYEEILSHFQVKKYGNGKVQALCPAHPDKEASLTITQGNNGRTLLKCHAGCSSESVVLAAGLKMADLFSESRPAEECWRMYIESREKRILIMKIMTQDKTRVLNFKMTYISYVSKNRICESDFSIAEYASPERAKEVLNDMFQKYVAGEKAYIMPEE